MKRKNKIKNAMTALAVLAALTASSFQAAADLRASTETPTAIPTEFDSRLAAMPLRFEPVSNSQDSRFDYVGRGVGYGLFIGGDANAFVVRSDEPGRSTVVGMSIIGANPASLAGGIDVLPSRSNVYRGNDSATWSSGLENYQAVRYVNIYRGVDVVFYGNQRQLEFDFTVSAGVDPAIIELAFDGVQSLQLDDAGCLVLNTEAGRVIQHAPIMYQQIDGREIAVSGRYELRGAGRVGFAIDRYDRCAPLVIDPVVNYSTLIGGSSADRIYDLAVDSQGQIYICGYTASSTFPDTLPGSLQGFWDMFVAKFNSSGSALVYATYLSAGVGVFDTTVTEYATGIAVDANGFACVVGNTNATDFPMVNAIQPQNAGGHDAVVVKLNPTGQIVFSTYLGGTGNENQPTSSSTRVGAIAVDDQGSMYIAGTSTSANYPLLNPFDATVSGSSCPGTCNDVVLTKLSNDGQSLVYSTFIGGSLPEEPVDIRIDTLRQVYLVVNDGLEVLVHKVRADGTGLVYSAILDNGPDGGSTIAHSFDVDAQGRVLVGGTTSSGSFPTTPGVWQATHGGSFDGHVWQGFVTVLSPDGAAIERSTYLGDATANETVTAIAVDSHGNAVCAVNRADHIGGSTVVNDLWKLNASLASRSVFMPIAGSGQVTEMEVDSQNNILYAGWVWSGALPTVTPGAFQTGPAGNIDGFVTVIDMQDPPAVEPLPGDINSDGLVNVTDLLAVIAAWGQCPAAPSRCSADVSGDGMVNVTDLLMVIGHWG